MAALVDDGGATKKAEDYLKWLAKRILEGAVSLLPAGCAAPPEPKPFLSVAAYSNRYDEIREIYVLDAVNKLRIEISSLKEKYRQFPDFSVEKPFKFNYGDAGTLSARLGKFGKASITLLFIFGHGRTDTYNGTRIPSEGSRGGSNNNEAVKTEITQVAGIPDYLIVEACMPYMKSPAWVRLTGCDQRNERWKALSRGGVEFGSSAAFEGREGDLKSGLEEMYRVHSVIIDGETVGPEYEPPKFPSLEGY